MQKINFIITSLSPWDFEYGSNIRDIALELSKEHNVLFVNIPIKYTEYYTSSEFHISDRKAVVKTKKNRIEKINNNCSVLTTPSLLFPINRLKSKLFFDILNRYNNKKYAKWIQKAIYELEWKNCILINDNDIYTSINLPELIAPKKSIYYLRDNMIAMDYWKMHAVRLEPLIIQNYDCVASNSLYLKNYAQQYNANSEYIGQGCDVEFFLHTPTDSKIPEDLENIAGKKIGYIGALNSERLDIDLLYALAKSNLQFSIVLIGPEDETFRNSKLHQQQNIYFLGTKDFNTINTYMYHFDVCINPQKSNDITVGNYPRKVDEYLAVGKPVVATYTETMEPFAEVTYLAKNYQQYSEYINLAITEDSNLLIEQRKNFAREHTWPNSVNKLLSFVNEI